MKRMIRGVLPLFAAILALTNSQPVQGQTQGSAPVTVVNPLPLPVTISGSNAVIGTVDANQSGTWTVNINGTALVKNVDEPGRQPYEAFVEFTRFGCSGFNCFNFGMLGDVILFDGPLVPTGKRLIVQNLSGRLPNDGGTDVSVILQTSQVVSQQLVKWGFYGPFFTQFGGLAGFSSQAFTTYGPGERPHFNVILPSANNFVAYIAISGYLIDATN